MSQADREAVCRSRDPVSGQYPARQLLVEFDAIAAEVVELRRVAAAWDAAREREAASKAAKREAKSRQQRARRAKARKKAAEPKPSNSGTAAEVRSQ